MAAMDQDRLKARASVAPVTLHAVFAELSQIACRRPRASEALRWLLTFDDRLPVEHGLAGLADFDRELYRSLDSDRKSVV